MARNQNGQEGEAPTPLLKLSFDLTAWTTLLCAMKETPGVVVLAWQSKCVCLQKMQSRSKPKVFGRLPHGAISERARDENTKSKSNLSIYSVDYAEACNELARPISASLRPGNTAPFEEMSQWWRAVGSTVSD